MTQVAYVLMPFSQPSAVYLDPDTMLADVRKRHPNTIVERTEKAVKIRHDGRLLYQYPYCTLPLVTP